MKTILTLSIFSALTAHLIAQPGNDACGSATTLTVGAACTNGTNVAATLALGEAAATLGAGANNCWGTAANQTVWYTFTTAAAGTYNIGTTSSATDTQIKIISGSCAVPTVVACSEDWNGASNAFAALVSTNLAATTTYLVQVDVYGASTGAFCINVDFVAAPVNDCILNAIDLTATINGLSSSNLFDCTTYTYNQAGPGGDPTADNLAGDPNGCNGAGLLPPFTPTADHRDIWFKFTVSGSTPPAWLSVFQQTGTAPYYSSALYSGTPAGTCGGAGSITGMTQIDCSSGDNLEILPTDNLEGDARDKGACTTPIHARLDVSNLANGTYYFRIWETFGGAPSDGIINLCAESATPGSVTSDKCPSQNTVGCDDNMPNQDVSQTYTDQGNSGMTGNSCNTATDEPQLAVGAAGQLKDNCAGGWVTQVGYANNVMNNSAIYQFTVNSSAPCTANVLVELSNVQFGGTDGNIAQVQVMNGTCAGGTSAIMTGTSANSCMQLRPVGGTLPNGTYYIVVDGQDGQLLQYDLSLSITHTGIGCTANPCGVFPLGVTFTDLKIELLSRQIALISWKTSLEENNDYFIVERTYDGISFENVTQIKGQGNSSEESKYEFYDSNLDFSKNHVYYRIKQVDFNGQSTYSDMKFVQLDNKNKKLSKTVNLMGQEVDQNYKGFIIEVYSDGSTQKMYK